MTCGHAHASIRAQLWPATSAGCLACSSASRGSTLWAPSNQLLAALKHMIGEGCRDALAEVLLICDLCVKMAPVSILTAVILRRIEQRWHARRCEHDTFRLIHRRSQGTRLTCRHFSSDSCRALRKTLCAHSDCHYPLAIVDVLLVARF